MKSYTCHLPLCLCLAALLSGPLSARAATIWNGPAISESDATEPDQMTARVWLTRGGSQGLYNAVTETGFTHFFSPEDTEWADGTTANYATLPYTDWNTWAKGVHAGPPSTVGVHAVVHLKTDDIYVDIMFTSWSVGSAYSYVRGTLPAANLPPTVALVSPTNGAAFTAPALVPITANASDPDGSVTNVAFFDGGAPLGGTNNPPYAVTANLAVGSHALTAVATDNLGLSTTSAVVTVTVTAANIPPTVALVSPTNGASFTAPAIVPVVANASDSDGSVTNVAFFDGATFLGGTNNTPYTVTASLATGSHALTAVATDNGGLSTTSAVVNVTVSSANIPPSVTITNPPDPAIFGNTDSVGIGASVTNGTGTVTNVQIFNGAAVLRTFTAPPYTFTTAPFTFLLGTNTVTAVATDNLGLKGTSAPVHVVIERYTPEVTNGLIPLFLVTVATNLSAPDYGISPPGDTHRLFVLEQNGLMRVIQDGVLLPTPALDIQSRVSPPLNTANATDERGLLGLAFHPGYTNPASPGYRTLYTYNSEMIPTNTLPTYPLPAGATNNYRNVLNEWKITSTNASVIDPNSRREIISFGKNAQNHNGGTCTFGPDGYIYLALGDGGNANDVGPGHISPGGNAQNLSTPLGKFLRFDPLNPALNPGSPDPVSTNGQYRIPTSNPFQGPGQVPEIYCYGMRNPYRFCFDFVTGDLIHADVGQNDIEEIDRILIGHNYGWAVKEGDFLFNMTNGPAGSAGTIGTPPGYFSPGVPAGLTDPISGPQGILQYDHNNGISITGGFVYRGSAMPELYGKYIFGDLAIIASPTRIDGKLFYADLQQGTMNLLFLPQYGTNVMPNNLTVHGFGQDGNGELYAMTTSTPANGNGGVVFKLASVRLSAQVVGNQLTLSWPVAGGRLQVQVNSPGVGLGTNWVTVAGSAATNHVVMPIDPANGSVFYRLAVP